MHFRDAREFVRSKFDDPESTVSQATEYDREQFKKLLYTLGSGRQFTKHSLGLPGEMFLFSGCLRFDRWNPPGPYVLQHDDRKHFRQFLKTLDAVGADPNNTTRFKLGELKWDIFETLDRVPISSVSADQLSDWRNRLADIPRPTQKEKIREYEQLAGACKALIRSAEEATIRTNLRTMLPVVPLEQPTVIECMWEDLEVAVSLQPRHQIPGNTFTTPGGDSVAIPMEPSQWQHGFTETEITVHGLVDPRVPEPSLTTASHQLPSDNWPAMWVFTFELLEAVLWKLRVKSEASGKWLPSPNDLGALTWNLECGGESIDSLTQDPPGLTIKLVSGEQDTQRMALGDLSLVPWFVRCRELAKDYAATGETNEALFWLNIGAEALFDTRCRAMCSHASIEYDDLSSGRSYWDKAREFVEERIPDAAERLNWPAAASGTPSWFTQIRELDDYVDFAEPCDKILNEYANIHKHRNDVFHGTRRDRVEVSEVRRARESLEWLISNFWLAEDSPDHRGDT